MVNRWGEDNHYNHYPIKFDRVREVTMRGKTFQHTLH